MKVLCIIPCLNEVGVVRQLVRAMPACVTQTLVVDDGSDDGTGSFAADAGARVLRHDEPRGVGAALRAGYAVAVREGFDIAVVLAGNGKDDPAEVPRVLEPIEADAADFVQGSRWLGQRASLGAMPGYRRLATRLLHPLLFGLATGRFVTESTNGFRAVHRRVLTDPRLDLRPSWLDGYQLEPWLYVQALALGYRAVEVPVHKVYPRRDDGQTVTKMTPGLGWAQLLEPLAWAGLSRLSGLGRGRLEPRRGGRSTR